MNIEKNTMWFNTCRLPGIGYIVTGISDVIGESVTDRFEDMYLPSLDCGYLLKPWTEFFWLKEDAMRFIANHEGPITRVVYI